MVATLTWVMIGAGAVIWLVVMAMAVRAVTATEPLDEQTGRRLVIGCGVVLPTVALGALLAWGLSMMPALTAPGDSDVHVRIVGEQWWWRVAYEGRGGGPIELANELVLPVGERVTLQLESADVVHSFWVPSLGGKMDMIPGRTTFLALEPTRTGVFEGVCAEFCGSSHARMLFDVEVVEREAFDAWLDEQRQPASDPAGPMESRGQALFARYGCDACHRIRGTDANGRIGPDLTHVASRLRLGAGVVDTSPAGFREWLRTCDTLKPEVHMPAFDMLDDAEQQALVEYLVGLR